MSAVPQVWVQGCRKGDRGFVQVWAGGGRKYELYYDQGVISICIVYVYVYIYKSCHISVRYVQSIRDSLHIKEDKLQTPDPDTNIPWLGEKSYHQTTMYSPSPRFSAMTSCHRNPLLPYTDNCPWGGVQPPGIALFQNKPAGAPENLSNSRAQIFSNNSRQDRLLEKPESLEMSQQRFRIAVRWHSATHSEPTIKRGQRRYTSD